MHNKATNSSDHDLLITLTATIDAFMKRYESDMVQLKDGYTAKINDHETRIKLIEKTSDQIDPLGTYRKVQSLEQEFHDWKTTANIVRIIGGFAGGVVFFVLTQIPNILKLMGITK